MNKLPMLVTLPKLGPQLFRFWSNAMAPLNIPNIFVAELMSQREMLLLKAAQPLKQLEKFFTDPVGMLAIDWLKTVHFSNIDRMF